MKLLDSLPGQDGVIPAVDIGNGVQCVGLIKMYSKSGAASTWKQGDNVMESKDILP